jgi:hypothetical protein
MARLLIVGVVSALPALSHFPEDITSAARSFPRDWVRALVALGPGRRARSKV